MTEYVERRVAGGVIIRKRENTLEVVTDYGIN